MILVFVKYFFLYCYCYMLPSGFVKTIFHLKPQSHIHGFGPGRATVHPDLASQ